MTLEAWTEKNQRHLVGSITEIEILLKRFIGSQNKQENSKKKIVEAQGKFLRDSLKFSLDNPDIEIEDFVSVQQPPALETICKLFGLSNFERSILLLCAAVELKTEIADLCATAHGNPNSSYATFGLALAALPNPHWSALVPTSPLRRFRLITLSDYPQVPITKCPIKIEERVLHYLVGVSYPDKQVLGLMITPVRVKAPISASQQQLAEEILYAWSKKGTKNKNIDKEVVELSPEIKDNEFSDIACVHLWGPDEFSKQIIARFVCNKLGFDVWQISAEFIPLKSEEIEMFAAVWCREASLIGCGLYICAKDVVDVSLKKTIAKLLASDYLPRPLFLSTEEYWSLLDPFQTISFEISKPLKSERRKIWQECIKAERLSRGITITISDEELSKLAGHFDFNSSNIISAVREALFLMKGFDSNFDSSSQSTSSFVSALWKTSRTLAHTKMGELAIKIVPKVTLQDLVLPAKQKQLLQTMAIQVKNKTKVYEDWGFEAKSSRGLGITTLFTGESGTGKTMAAEALANELDLDLFKIDLANIVSKYIGETEKNLRKVFEAAESGAILFFDEADALFGKRSEVKDSHDRYANIEVGYLLQKMEEYSGLAILATNMKTALDTAFIRRIRFIVKFPFPDEESRAEIWRRIFPKLTPTKNLNIERLAKLNITGGNIRNIALNAIFLAAEEGEVSMTHLKEAIKIEYDKFERPLPQAELSEW